MITIKKIALHCIEVINVLSSSTILFILPINNDKIFTTYGNQFKNQSFYTNTYYRRMAVYSFYRNVCNNQKKLCAPHKVYTFLISAKFRNDLSISLFLFACLSSVVNIVLVAKIKKSFPNLEETLAILACRMVLKLKQIGWKIQPQYSVNWSCLCL